MSKYVQYGGGIRYTSKALLLCLDDIRRRASEIADGVSEVLASHSGSSSMAEALYMPRGNR